METCKNTRVPLFGGKLTIIRPLAYVPEQEIRRYAQVSDFPPPPPQCPTGDASQRAVMRKVLHMVEKNNPHVRAHLWRAAKRYQAAVEKGSNDA